MEKTVNARIRNIIGQLEGVVRLRESCTECEAQLIQLKAIRAGINAIIQKIIEEELANCSKHAEKHEKVTKLVAELVRHT